jgi:DnaJ-class molecular chaperone
MTRSVPSVPRWERPATTTRRCMTCRGEFKFEGPHHRMCNDCRGKAARVSPFAPDMWSP